MNKFRKNINLLLSPFLRRISCNGEEWKMCRLSETHQYIRNYGSSSLLLPIKLTINLFQYPSPRSRIWESAYRHLAQHLSTPLCPSQIVKVS
jgi:hypothetical protein